MKRTFFVVLAFSVLSACGKDADHPPQTKEWYMQHDNERHTRVAECKNNAAQKVLPDCQNALDAQAQITAFGK